MSEPVYENLRSLGDSWSADLMYNANPHENICMNEARETQGTRNDKGTMTSASKPITAGCRCYRLAVVCLLMLVVLLLAAITILWVNFNYLTTERYQLQMNYNNLTTAIDQLETSYNNLTVERDHLKTSYKNLIAEKEQLETNNTKLASERIQLETSYKTLSGERDQFQRKRDELQKKLSKLKADINTPGWKYFSSSIYFISVEKKNWSESRQDCKHRGVDLVIINSREEQDFVDMWRKGNGAWLGANDIDSEGDWTWVDGTAVTNGFWNKNEPNNINDEDCAVSGYKSEPVPRWDDISCSSQYNWICEKKII